MQTESTDETYNLDLLSQSQDAWDRSEGLRFVYGEIYRSILSHCVKGTTLEIGSGIGVANQFFDNLVTSDVIESPYVNRAMSAYEVGLDAECCWGNIFAIDVLHHLRFPMRFFESASSALNQGGRIILVEPAATFLGRVFYSLCHHEPIQSHLIVPPFEFESNGANKEFANMGMGVGLFVKNRSQVNTLLSTYGLRCNKVSFRDVCAYPLTGGYSKPQFMPTTALKFLLKCEKYLPQCVLSVIGLRMLIVIEKIK